MAVQSFFNKKFIIVFAGWYLLWVALQTMVLYRYTGDAAVNTIDALISLSFIAAAGLLVVNNFKYYFPGQERFWYIAVISAVLGATTTGLSAFTLHLIFWNNSTYKELINQSWLLRFALSFLLIACTCIISLLWYSLQEQKETEARTSNAERMLKDAELFSLRQQLQPHFLFNSLNSISALTITNAEEARHMIQQLSDFLRSTLQRNEQQMISLQEELKQLQLYLDIEKVRFGHRLQTEIQCSEESLPLLVPALLLQPVVENAIKFGLYDTLDDVTIAIATAKHNNQLIISISNPFDAETAYPVHGTGFGLPSIRRRLYLLFARQDLLEVVQNENIFTVTIIIPASI